ncbi:hypothetical protein CJ469_02288 [Nocardia farcinica]|nr:hypothetical protein CJ469_02288 [Nocardia farcinica]PFX08393.1 hypothetical protein CJ468_02570 [Nocardia farcinica]
MVRGREWTGFEAAALQEAMRRSVREFAALLGVETTTVAHWRANLGAVTPRGRTQAILDTAYEQRATPADRSRFEQIVAEGENVWRARHGQAERQRERDSTSPAVASDGIALDDPSELIRRMHRIESLHLDDTVLEAVDLALSNLLDRYEHEGPVRLLPGVHALRREVDRLVESCHKPAQLQRLYRISGQLAGILGYMSVNCGRFHHSELYSREALGLADFLGDIELKAWVRGTQSFCAYYKGDFRKAAALAAEGIALLPDGGQAIRLYTNGLARALGKLGDVLGVERAIESAVALTSSVETPSGLTPAMSFDTYGDARWKANAATAYLSAGLYDKSLAYGRQVEVLVESSESAWSRALVRLDMATALVRRRPRDVERAVALGEEALEVSRARPIRSVWQRAHELGEAVTAVDRRRGRSYLEALREWPAGDTVAVTGGGSTTREI